MSLGVGISTGSSASSSSAAVTSQMTATWTSRNDGANYYVAEEISGMAKVEYGPMGASIVTPLITERKAWFELQLARFRVMAGDIQAFCARQPYPR